ncbi:elongator complex protein 3 [Pseudothermotoga thermarum]|uniref:Radical SAM domain protein n=1 Tax=Pseudothermotoga thermarum DSM 5069 TaxID=688269 RepID=F7YY41_9THEM|nr:radical SAM protein [Pseudothermotoga thermarum]AEH50851.1 Radical SAM domain protein [Pseudothermotoga thermarum DSM 5069]
MRIFPVFIPQGGCKNKCIFCNQQGITGVSNPISFQELDWMISSFLQVSKEKFEIAFYGGTFTGLPESDQLLYLKWANKYIQKGLCEGIRISTRPDEIDEEKITMLKEHGVKFVEIGVQSFDDDVLQATKRGYTAKEVEQACLTLKKHSVDFGVHLMVGLPESDYWKEIKNAEKTAEIGAKTCRIHPTLVLKNTKLENWYKDKIYKLLSIEEALDVCSDMLAILIAENVKVIRIGLFVPKDQEETIVAGPYHPRFGELTRIKLLKKLAQFLNCNTIVTDSGTMNIHKIESVAFFNKDFKFVTGDGMVSLLEAVKAYVGGVLTCSKT